MVVRKTSAPVQLVSFGAPCFLHDANLDFQVSVRCTALMGLHLPGHREKTRADYRRFLEHLKVTLRVS